MADGYEQEDKDIVMNDNTIGLSSVSAEDIYDMLGCGVLDDES